MDPHLKFYIECIFVIGEKILLESNNCNQTIRIKQLEWNNWNQSKGRRKIMKNTSLFSKLTAYPLPREYHTLLGVPPWHRLLQSGCSNPEKKIFILRTRFPARLPYEKYEDLRDIFQMGFGEFGPNFLNGEFFLVDCEFPVIISAPSKDEYDDEIRRLQMIHLWTGDLNDKANYWLFIIHWVNTCTHFDPKNSEFRLCLRRISSRKSPCILNFQMSGIYHGKFSIDRFLSELSSTHFLFFLRWTRTHPEWVLRMDLNRGRSGRIASFLSEGSHR